MAAAVWSTGSACGRAGPRRMSSLWSLKPWRILGCCSMQRARETRASLWCWRMDSCCSTTNKVHHQYLFTLDNQCPHSPFCHTERQLIHIQQISSPENNDKYKSSIVNTKTSLHLNHHYNWCANGWSIYRIFKYKKEKGGLQGSGETDHGKGKSQINWKRKR